VQPEGPCSYGQLGSTLEPTLVQAGTAADLQEPMVVVISVYAVQKPCQHGSQREGQSLNIVVAVSVSVLTLVYIAATFVKEWDTNFGRTQMPSQIRWS
jgi:hypothetical protein